ncbi:MAG: hypothetical protein OSB65_10910 [Roseibacillus sp.]|nr:hypothetical protein [Roseibacillus sp.]
MHARILSSCLSALVLAGILGFDSAIAKLPAELKQQIAAIQAVGPEGAGNPAAAIAFKELSASRTDAILPLLRAIESSGPLARNWLRSAVEVIVERELRSQKTLPVDGLRVFLLDTRQAPEARRLAYDLLAKIDPASAKKLIPGFLNDPSTELRRDAVAQLVTKGKSLTEDDKAAAIATYRKALDAARDVDQVKVIATELSETLGQEVDLPRHFGFLVHWQVIGPFDNSGRDGFAAVFPPEKKVDLDAAHAGKGEEQVKWQPLVSTNEYGKIDLNKPLGKLKEVTGYAYSEFVAEQAGPAELRLGCKNAWKIWLNGELMFGRDEYHRGQRIDQYKMSVHLKEGKNVILVKLCQNEMKEKWTVEWEFQLRVCDATGTAILSTGRPATPKAEAATK